MPLQSITHAASRGTKLDGEITPAELPSGRVRFSDELGRETALVSRREPEEPARAAEDAPAKAPRDGDPALPRPLAKGDAATRVKGAPTPGAPAPAKAPRAAPRDERKQATPAPEGDDEIALALAELGLAPPPPVTPPQPPPALLDPSVTSTVSRVALATPEPAAAPSLVEAPAPETGEAAPSSFVAARSEAGALELAPALVPSSEKSGAREAAPETKVARAESSKAASAARLLEIAAASHAAAGAGRAAAAETSAVHSNSPAPEPAAPPAPEVAPRIPLADLPSALPALLDEADGHLRFGRRGSKWEVELRLDPPELGSLRIRFELHGDSIRGAIQCEPRVERMLGPVLKELEEELDRQGGDASFDLSRRGGEEEERPFASRPWRAPPVAASPAARRDPSARTDPSRLVDVTA